MAATLLLDTCAWLDAFAAPELLRPTARKLLAGESKVHVSAISLVEIAIEATRLPGWVHKDPADQIIVATARLHGLKILTSDPRILQYRQTASIASRKQARS